MDDVFVYFAKLPPGIHEAVMPCSEGYTVYLNEQDSRARQIEAYDHALKHIVHNDWSETDVQNVESRAHG